MYNSVQVYNVPNTYHHQCQHPLINGLGPLYPPYTHPWKTNFFKFNYRHVYSSVFAFEVHNLFIKVSKTLNKCPCVTSILPHHLTSTMLFPSYLELLAL